MTEIELKFRLESDADRARLEEVLGEPLERLHLATRYWLPTGSPGAAVRLREVSGATEASIKRSEAAPDEGLFIHSEQTQRLDAGAAVAYISGERPLDELPLVTDAGLTGPFRYVGLILTRRHVYRIKGMPLEVDAITYPDGGQEFEVEVETADADALRGDLEALAARAGIRLQPSETTKLGRLLARAGEEVLP